MPAGTKVSEGKTKVVSRWPKLTPFYVLDHKDDITAGDGARHEVIVGKGLAACRTTTNVFRLLNREGIPTHFVEAEPSDDLAPNQMLVIPCDMIKIEVVSRRRATGSYLKRNPQVAEGTRFETPVVEFFLKDDSRHDPLLAWNKWDRWNGQWVYWVASKPIAEQVPQVLESDFRLSNGEQFDVVSSLPLMEKIMIQVFQILEEAWQRLDVELIDMKIEFGFTSWGQLVVADVIDNDSWRLWPGGIKGKQLDKQVFRDLDVITDQALDEIGSNYQLVAILSDRMLVNDQLGKE